jgi:RNA 3'-terminal phosphate cyclase
MTLIFGCFDVLSHLEHFFAFSLVAETSTGCLLGGSALGKRNVKAEQVGQKAADELLQSINTKACVDSYSQDQVILQTLFFKHC